MDLREIQNKSNTLLAGIKRKHVFGYDDDAAYAEDISNLELAEGNSISYFCDCKSKDKIVRFSSFPCYFLYFSGIFLLKIHNHLIKRKTIKINQPVSVNL